MGFIKTRVYPKDITINIGKGEPIPEHPYSGQKWKEVRSRSSASYTYAGRCSTAQPQQCPTAT